jgi:hypothetical protein
MDPPPPAGRGDSSGDSYQGQAEETNGRRRAETEQLVVPAPLGYAEIGNVRAGYSDIEDQVAVIGNLRVVFQADPDALRGWEKTVKGQAQRVEQVPYLTARCELQDLGRPGLPG